MLSLNVSVKRCNSYSKQTGGCISVEQPLILLTVAAVSQLAQLPGKLPVQTGSTENGGLCMAAHFGKDIHNDLLTSLC